VVVLYVLGAWVGVAFLLAVPLGAVMRRGSNLPYLLPSRKALESGPPHPGQPVAESLQVIVDEPAPASAAEALAL
jgi:hypothetical protein